MAAEGSEFLYRQVERHVRDLIDTGVLRPGDRAPSLRRMSRQADVSIATVTAPDAAPRMSAIS